ncbi:MAG: ABC transporter ATP-binding protein [Spirochaetes bacterium]|nr:ABC transporter ATP-binding protein [Spirochaetota bacterium]
MSLLEVKSLYAGFRIKGEIYPAARDISFSLEKGQALGIIGESGCGKTVTAYSIMRLLQSPGEIISGSVYFKEEDLLQYSKEEMRKIRGKEISMIFQEPSTALDPCYTAGYQISETILAHQNISKAEAKNKAIALIDSMKIPDPEKIYNCYPHELSGGMQQRIMIASALASGSSLMIADEPTTALDVTVQSQILSILKSKVQNEGLSLIFISHDLGITANLCDRTAVLYAGEIVEIGSSETIFSDPIHPYTQALIESIPSQNRREKHLNSIQGNVPPIDYETKGCRFYDRCSERSSECLENKILLEDKKRNHSARCIKK